MESQRHITDKTCFELLATYFANPLVVWLYAGEDKARGKWVTTQTRFLACSKHARTEIEEYIRGDDHDAGNIRDITAVSKGLHPAAVTLASGLSLFSACALCSKPGVVGLRDPLTDIREIADACRQMAVDCNRIRHEADWWRQVLSDMAEWLMRRALIGDAP